MNAWPRKENPHKSVSAARSAQITIALPRFELSSTSELPLRRFYNDSPVVLFYEKLVGDAVRVVLLTITGLFSIVDPLAGSPNFLAMTRD